MKKFALRFLAFVFGLIFFCLISLFFFFKPISEAVLHAAGYPQATVGGASLSLDGSTLTNIKFNDPALDLSIGEVRAYATMEDFFSRRLGRVVIADAVYRLGDNETAGGEKPFTFDPASLPPLPVRELEITAARIILPLDDDAPPVELQVQGTLLDRGGDYHAAVKYETAPHDMARLAGQATATLTKADRRLAAHTEIAEGKLSLPDIDIKRLTGWASVEWPASGMPQLDAQLTAGAFNLYGLPFQGMTLTAAADDSNAEVLLNGQAAQESGEVSADIRLDRQDAAENLTIAVKADLKNLEALGVAGLTGRGNMTLNIAGQKTKDAPWNDPQAWQKIKGDMTVSAQQLSLKQAVRKATADIAASLSLDPVGRTLTVRADKIDLNEARFFARGGKADVSILAASPSAIDGKISFVEIGQGGASPFLVPLRLSLQLASLSSRQHTTGFSGELTEKNGLIAARLSGRHEMDTGKGNATIEMQPVTLVEGVHDLADLSPFSLRHAEDVTGTLGFTATAAWSEKGLGATTGQIYLKSIKATVQETLFDKVNAVVKLDNLNPPAFQNQVLSVGLLHIGLPLTNGEVEASLSKDRILNLHHTSWDVAGGKVSAEPFSLSLDKMSASPVLTASGLKLPELFKIAPMDGLDATGTVNGKLPLKISPDSIAVENGVLESDGPGAIRYNPQEVPAFLKDNANQQIVDLRVALKAFEFESLQLMIDGELGKNQKISLKTKGKNPEFYGGHPVALNLNVEGPLQNVLKYSPGGTTIPDSIKKQLEQYEQQHVSP